MTMNDSAKIKVRGNTSAYGSKKPYKLKLSKKNDFGMGSSAKKWVLLNDGTNLKYLFGNKGSTFCGVEWQPTFQYVNLYFNDDYRGCYILTEAVENIEKRLDMDENGFLIENDPYWWNEDVYFKVDGQIYPLGFTFKYPDSDDIVGNDEYIDSIQASMNGVIATIRETSTGDYAESIDLESFAAWYLVNDYYFCLDSAGANMFWYRVSGNEKIKLGPTWDYGNDYQGNKEEWSSIHASNLNWGAYLFHKSSFRKSYRNLFEKKRHICEDLESYVNDYIDKYGYALQESWNADAERWGGTAGNVQAQKEEFLDYWKYRRDWIDNASADWSLDFSNYNDAIYQASAYAEADYDDYDALRDALDVNVYDLDFTQEELDKTTRMILNGIKRLRLKSSTEIPTYTVRYVSDGSIVHEEEHPYSEVFECIDNPVKEGNTFTGWYIDESCTEFYDFNELPIDDVMIYAGWKPNNYTISFNSNGGSAVDSVVYAFGTNIECPPDPVYDGCDFAGWFIDEDLTEQFEFDRMPAHDVFLYAKWVKKNDPPADSPVESGGGSDAPRVSDPYSKAHDTDGSSVISVSDGNARYVFDAEKSKTVVVMKRINVLDKFKEVTSDSKYISSARHRYVVDDSEVASITRKGILKPKKNGEVNISLEQKVRGGSWEKIGSPIHLYVQLPEMKEKISTVVGKSISGYSFLSHTTYSPTRWISTNKNVATVDDNGTITVHKKGFAKIVAVYGEGKYSSKKKYATKLRAM